MNSSSVLRSASRLQRALGVLYNQNPISLPFQPRRLLRRRVSVLLQNGGALGSESVKPWRVSINPQAVRNMATVRRQTGSRTVDIGARARQLQTRRLWTYALSFSAIAGFIIIVLSSFEEYLVFYITPTDALEKFNKDPSKNKFRLGGLVLEGSVLQAASTTETEFVVTDLITDVLVRYNGALPDLFREGHSVVVEGFVRPLPSENSSSSARSVTEKARSNGCYFSATEVLAKHDEKYMPKEVAEAIEKNRAKIEAAHPGLAASQQHSKEVHS